jgi:hypothetical protein
MSLIERQESGRRVREGENVNKCRKIQFESGKMIKKERQQMKESGRGGEGRRREEELVLAENEVECKGEATASTCVT